MKTARVVALLLTLFVCTRLTLSANILAIFLYTFSTPYSVVQPYFKALVSKGHNVTIISSVGLLPDIQGVRHVRVANLDVAIDYLLNNECDPEHFKQKWNGAMFVANFYYNLTHAILSDSGVQSLLKDKSENFDLVVMEPTFADSLIGFAEHYNALQLGFGCFGSSWLVDYYAGNSGPSVYRPVSPMGYSVGESVLDKWYNWMYLAEEWMVDRLLYVPVQVKLYRRYFPYSTEKFYERRRNFSLMLINQHFSMGRVMSNYPNIIEVAGMHMAEPITPLEPELLEFLEGAEHGVIYFSMGLEILTKYLPEKMDQKMLKTFSQLKQRVVWKHEMGTIVNKSENIYITTIASQRQLLDHPNMKLFITHGGILSLIEATYSGVPLLGLPVYFDQFDNIESMKRVGVARSLDINTLTVEQLTDNIEELLTNPKYTLKAKEMSFRFRDQPMSPLDRAVWWTEYVLRHKGAPNIRMSEQDMGILHSYSIQFFSLVSVRIALTALVLFIAGCMTINCLFKEFKKIYGSPIYYNAINTVG